MSLSVPPLPPLFRHLRKQQHSILSTRTRNGRLLRASPLRGIQACLLVATGAGNGDWGAWLTPRTAAAACESAATIDRPFKAAGRPIDSGQRLREFIGFYVRISPREMTAAEACVSAAPLASAVCPSVRLSIQVGCRCAVCQMARPPAERRGYRFARLRRLLCRRPRRGVRARLARPPHERANGRRTTRPRGSPSHALLSSPVRPSVARGVWRMHGFGFILRQTALARAPSQ